MVNTRMKTLIALTMAAGLFATSAEADYRRQNHRSQGHYQQHRNHGNWVAPLVGGLLLGGIVAGTYGYNRYYQPQCWDEQIGYDRYGRSVWQRYCQ
jgi:hypothetical protein